MYRTCEKVKKSEREQVHREREVSRLFFTREFTQFIFISQCKYASTNAHICMSECEWIREKEK